MGSSQYRQYLHPIRPDKAVWKSRYGVNKVEIEALGGMSLDFGMGNMNEAFLNGQQTKVNANQ